MKLIKKNPSFYRSEDGVVTVTRIRRWVKRTDHRRGYLQVTYTAYAGSGAIAQAYRLKDLHERLAKAGYP